MPGPRQLRGPWFTGIGDQLLAPNRQAGQQDTEGVPVWFAAVDPDIPTSPNRTVGPCPTEGFPVSETIHAMAVNAMAAIYLFVYV